jgi:hypothetical protein
MPLKGVLEKRGYLRKLRKGGEGVENITDSYTVNYEIAGAATKMCNFCPGGLLMKICFLPAETGFSLCAKSFT